MGVDGGGPGPAEAGIDLSAAAKAPAVSPPDASQRPGGEPPQIVSPQPGDPTATYLRATDTSVGEQRSEQKANREDVQEIGTILLDLQQETVRGAIEDDGTPTDELKPGEKVLYASLILSERGFGDSFKRGPIDMQQFTPDGNLTVTTADGTEHTITALMEPTDADPTTYICDSGDGKTVTLTGTEIADALKRKHAKDIGETFPDGSPERKLAEWSASGAEGDIPLTPDELSAVEQSLPAEELSPEKQRIADEIRRLEGKTDKLTDKEQALLISLKVAQKMQDSEVGDLFTYSALKQLQDALPKKLMRTGKVTIGKDVASEYQEEWDSLQEMIDYLEPKAKAQRDELFGLLEGKMDSKNLERLQKLAQEPGGMMKVFQDSEFSSLLTDPRRGQEVCEMFFGKDMTEKELEDQFKDIIPPELQKALKEGGKASWLKILLMIAAGILVVPTVAVGGGAIAVGTGVLRQSGQ